jgi:hypothetical protein
MVSALDLRKRNYNKFSSSLFAQLTRTWASAEFFHPISTKVTYP